mmetsp:Transcript_529/g.1528  ORF Transcript_529/g.1528 Transcript_529/m.1528 type:complete len:207 (-) Transcript_529:529-1149(-)
MAARTSAVAHETPVLRDLERDVVDTELVLANLAEVLEHLVCVLARGRAEHVRGERQLARGEGPQVEAVDRSDVRSSREHAPQLVRVDVGGRRLHQHGVRLAEQAQRAREHPDGGCGGDDGVQPHPPLPVEGDEGGSDQHAAALRHVPRYMYQGGSRRHVTAAVAVPVAVVALVAASAEEEEKAEVGGEPEGSHAQHGRPVGARLVV